MAGVFYPHEDLDRRLSLGVNAADTDKITMEWDPPTGSTESFADWSNFAAVLTEEPDSVLQTSCDTSLDGEVLTVIIRPTHKATFGLSEGWWRATGDDADGDPQVILGGPIVIRD